MSTVKNIVYAGLFIRSLPLLIPFAIFLTLFNGCSDMFRSYPKLAYHGYGHINFYMADEKVIWQCNDLEIALDDSEATNKPTITGTQCDWFEVVENGGSQSQDEWTYRAGKDDQDLGRTVYSSNVYKYLRNVGNEFVHTAVRLSDAEKGLLHLEDCVVDWSGRAYKKRDKREYGVDMYCPDLLAIKGAALPPMQNPKYSGYRPESHKGSYVSTWVKKMSEIENRHTYEKVTWGLLETRDQVNEENDRLKWDKDG